MHEVSMHYECNLLVVTIPDGIIETFRTKGTAGFQGFVTRLDI